MRRRGIGAVALALGLPGALACGDLLRPADYGDPSQYVLASPASFACNRWSPTPPAASLGLFDVYFHVAGLGPSAGEIRDRAAQAIRGEISQMDMWPQRRG